MVQIRKEVCCDARFVGQIVNICQEPKLELLDFSLVLVPFCLSSQAVDWFSLQDTRGGEGKES